LPIAVGGSVPANAGIGAIACCTKVFELGPGQTV